MKKLGFFICIIFVYNAKADHILGADITYKCIDTNIGKYRFRVSLYRDCSGIEYSSENLEIRKTGFSGTVPLVFKYKEDVTNLCQVPDVATNSVTNCIDTSSLIKGVERYVYEVDYVVGKNIGWAYVAWTGCCRGITSCWSNISPPIWVQAALNTSYFNNSIVYTNNIIPKWCRQRFNSYSSVAVDSFDEKYIQINGQNIIKDSIVYDMISPMIGEANPNTGINPTVSFNPPLNKLNFLYTTTGVNFDSKTGLITTIPSIAQNAVIAQAVKEYRAIPNPNGIGYTRTFIGYSIRDLQINIGDLCSPISAFTGLNIDSSKGFEPTNSSNSFKTCKQTGIKLQFKLINYATNGIKLKDISSIDTNLIRNYSTTTFIKSGNNYDTTYVNLNFDFKQLGVSNTFYFKAYYCNSIGQKIDQIIPIEISHNNIGKVFFQSDSIQLCISTNKVKLSLAGAESVIWQSQTPINIFLNSDSNIIEFYPHKSQWVYANNKQNTETCRVDDSIYIHIDTCGEINGKLYLDNNSNCLYDSAVDDVIPNYKIDLINLDKGIKKYLFSDINGNFNTKFSRVSMNEFKLKDKILCQISDSIFPIFPILKDTVLDLKIPFNSSNLNFKLSVIPSGIVSLTTNLTLRINSFAIFPISNTLRTYIVTIPKKAYFKSIVPNSFTTNGNKISFTNTGQNTYLTLSFDSLNINDNLCFKIKLDKVEDELDTTDNEQIICLPASVGIDPNHKSVSSRSQVTPTIYTDKTDALVYTVQFQNTGNGSARDIFILDTLDTKLDIETFSVLSSSHVMQTNLDTNRVVKFDFKNINLPDSNSNEPKSHGYVQYSIKAYSNLTLGQKISNQAAIYFDFNPPIYTNTTISQFDKTVTIPEASISTNTKNQSWVYPTILKQNSVLQIQVFNPKFNLCLYALDGRKLQEWSNQKTIQLNQISKGNYLLKLESENENLSQKIIVE